MIIYSGNLKDFKKDVDGGIIADKIERCFLLNGRNHNNPREHDAYKNSLRVRRDVLCDKEADINPLLKVAIEFKIPLTSKRVDFLITGLDDYGNQNAIIIELKQWSECKKTDLDDLVETYVGGSDKRVTHPCYQALSYSKTIQNFNQTVQDKPVYLHPCAYCHNYEELYEDQIRNNLYAKAIKECPLFLSTDREKLRSFIKRYVKKPDDGEILYEKDNGKIRPSLALQDALISLRHGNKVFTRIDEQKVAYSVIKKIIHESYHRKGKHTIIVKGGPGTGKSVIARNLLTELRSKRKEGRNVAYVSKNAAPRNVYAKELIGKDFTFSYLENLFKSSGSFVNAKENEFDCLLVDEAHRLNAKSGLFSSRGENQIKEIIHASKVSVFFLDEDQIVTSKDIGTAKEIEKWAREENSTIHEGENLVLASQFRCGGSDGYLAFLDNLLGIRETANTDLDGLEYDVKVFDNPCERRQASKEKNQNNKARMVAGYCYEWKSRKDASQFDIELEDGFKAQWNFSHTKTWAIDKDSFDQVGCIHTCQGLEFDYIGVIIGLDLRYQDGKVITDPAKRARTDSALKGCHEQVRLDKRIRNTYKTLLSRGRKGCYIYCQDKELANYIKARLEQKYSFPIR